MTRAREILKTVYTLVFGFFLSVCANVSSQSPGLTETSIATRGLTRKGFLFGVGPQMEAQVTRA